MNIQAIFMFISSGIIFLLGVAHLLLTFFGPKLLPRDRELIVRMQEISPVITRQTTVWKAWIGFNASHSLGAILFGVVYGYLALAHPGLLFASPFLLTAGFLTLMAYMLLALRYWFVTPRVGVGTSLAFFLASIVF